MAKTPTERRRLAAGGPGAQGSQGQPRRGTLGWSGGWWRAARRSPSPNEGPRPRGTTVPLVVLHSISLPPGQYGGDAIEQLFHNSLPLADHPYFAQLAGLRVSAHFLLRRDGSLLQFVSCDRRAWHAGVSSWRGRPQCNDYSIGIELEGLEGERFEPVQYAVLARLLRALARRYPLQEAVGHEHVAPGRKADPGSGFDWARLRQTLRRSGPALHGENPANTRPAGPKRPPGRTVARPWPQGRRQR